MKRHEDLETSIRGIAGEMARSDKDLEWVKPRNARVVPAGKTVKGKNGVKRRFVPASEAGFFCEGREYAPIDRDEQSGSKVSVISLEGELTPYTLRIEDIPALINKMRTCRNIETIASLVGEYGPLKRRGDCRVSEECLTVGCDTVDDWIYQIALVQTLFSLLTEGSLSKYLRQAPYGCSLEWHGIEGSGFDGQNPLTLGIIPTLFLTGIDDAQCFRVNANLSEEELQLIAQIAIKDLLTLGMRGTSFSRCFGVLPNAQIVEVLSPDNLCSVIWHVSAATTLQETAPRYLRLRRCHYCGEWDFEADREGNKLLKQKQDKSFWYHFRCYRSDHERKKREERAAEIGRECKNRPGARKHGVLKTR